MNKFICTGLAVLMILSLAAPVCAVTAEQTAEAQGLITPQFTHIMFIDSKLSITPMGEAICRGVVTLYSSSQTAELTVELQKQNGSGWTPIRSWTVSGPGLPGIEIERSGSGDLCFSYFNTSFSQEGDALRLVALLLPTSM